MTRALRGTAACLLAAFLCGACVEISPFDQTAYEHATALKAEALETMDLAGEDYSAHVADVRHVRLELDQNYEYAKGRPHNEISTMQWAIIRDPKGHSLGGFLTQWQAKKKLKPYFVSESEKIISDGFDMVIGLESGKIKR
ncbi:MAG TPA: hypothetical protein VK914_02185 [bacterium]|nr:hypothetical protein [bacterium]